MMASIFTDDFKTAPYWWEATPRPPMHDPGRDSLPAHADVVVVGSGYTGLSAAIQTTAHDCDTVVIDSGEIGHGCSTRNGGQVSTSLKPGYPALAKQYGETAALDILREGNHALAWVEQFINTHRIDCDFQKCGRFQGAHSRKAYAALKQKIRDIPPALNIEARSVEADAQHHEIGGTFYHGGVVYPHHACLDPARYHQGMVDCARKNGAKLIANCRVKKIRRSNGGFRLVTANGDITAAKVIIATSGYTGDATHWHRRRIIPVGSYIIATEPLPETTIARVIPTRRVITDTRKLVVYYRTSPDRRRILFGGRVSLNESNLRTSAYRLRREMVRLFPELAAAKISHSWMGFVGYTFDQLPHVGCYNGLHYSMGYCGSGVSLASYFGMKIGLQAVGDPAGATPFDRLHFPARAWYRGRPWFLAPAVFYYRWCDWRDRLGDGRKGGKKSRRNST